VLFNPNEVDSQVALQLMEKMIRLLSVSEKELGSDVISADDDDAIRKAREFEKEVKENPDDKSQNDNHQPPPEFNWGSSRRRSGHQQVFISGQQQQLFIN
jgi:hypothetical protein